MFNVGDLILYSLQGICCIDDICEKTFMGVTKSYYVLHPITGSKLKISVPVDSENVRMLKLLTKDAAKKVVESFRFQGIDWVETDNERNKVYSDIVKNGSRKEISMMANTLMREKIKIEKSGRKFHAKDRKLLTYIQDVLFRELAFSLNTTYEAVSEKINSFVNEN